MIISYIVVGLIVIVIFLFISIYNKLVRLRNYFKNAFSQIDVQLKRRYDLIPNLVETAKGFMKHERDTLEAVIKARNAAQEVNSKVSKNPADGQSMKKLAVAEGALTGAMGKFFALSESYPDLKSDHQMSKLMEELSSTENKVSFSRQAFNDSVTEYNNARELFPNSIVANMFNFQGAVLLESTETSEERKSVEVSF